MRWARAAAIGAAFGLAAAFGAPGPVQAQNKDLELLGKTRGEWIDILKSHKETKFRRASILVLEAFGPKTVGIVGALIEALEKEPEADLRREVALALGRMGTDAKDAASPLADAAKRDKEGTVRQAALAALGGKMLEVLPDSAPLFAAALKDPFPGARAAAIDGLRNLGDKAAIALPQAIEFAASAKEERIPRTVAVQVVARLGVDEPKAAQLMIALVQKADEPTPLRIAAADSLGRLKAGRKEAVELFAAVLKDGDAGLRLAAATSLARFGLDSKAAWPAVVADWNDPDAGIRHQFIRLAGMFGDSKEAIAKLADSAAKDPTAENRLAAIQELEQLGAKAVDAIPALMKLAEDDPRSSIREAAAAALKKIQTK